MWSFIIIEGFSLCFYTVDPCEFVVKVDPEVTGDYCLRIYVIIENLWGGSGSDLDVGKKLFVLICSV